MKNILERLTKTGIERLKNLDPILFNHLETEFKRQNNVLNLVAASSIADPSVLIAESMVTTNLTTEGYPGDRFHAGSEVIDKIENLAINRAKHLFNAQYANVQPHSGTSANQIVIFSLLHPGDTLLGLELNSGGHLTHGSKASSSGQFFNAIGYGLTEKGLIDYEQVAMLAKKHNPKLIICGASAYSRIIDFQRFRDIADEIGAYLLADISHIAGLVASDMHPSPIDYAHFTTTSTYKQLYGPRGGIIMIGNEHETLSPNGKLMLPKMIQQATFPFFQGTPNLSAIAAKARALDMAALPEFKLLMKRVIENARIIATSLKELGYIVLSGGTDNHTVLVDLRPKEITGFVAEKALEECNIILNKNRVSGDTKSSRVTSGIRIGTNSVSAAKMGPAQMQQAIALIDQVLTNLKIMGDTKYYIDLETKNNVIEGINSLTNEFPYPNYN